MDVKKSSEKINPLLKRKEITFFLDHDAQGTPPLYEVRTAIASLYAVNDDLVYVMNLRTLAGTNRTVGEAEIYDPPGTTRSLLPPHIHRRNQPARGKSSD
jgi:ribosomal protein S24E